MRQSFVQQSIILIFLGLQTPVSHGFLSSADIVRFGPSIDNLWSRAVPFIRRGDNDPEAGEDIPNPLGDCVVPCKLSQDTYSDENVAKRSTPFLRGCAKQDPSCGYISGNASLDSRPLEKRAPLPAFGGLNDLRRMTQAQLGTWMMNRMPDPRFHGLPPNVDMIWDERDQAQYIDIKLRKRTQNQKFNEYKPYAIPTSFFQQLDANNQPGTFAWGTIGLVGCSLIVIVKTPTPADPTGGVYMAHVWETPGFINDVEDGRIMTTALPKAYIENFMLNGFPQPFREWAPPNERDHNTAFQEGLNNHGAQLRNGFAIIVHPEEYNPQTINGVQTYVVNPGQPQHPNGLRRFRAAVDQAMQTNHQSQVNWQPEYLYLPAREDEVRTRAWSTPSGRTLFEYDPNFQLNGQTVRMGMLLIEDGGTQPGGVDANGNRLPGPGGPFFFQF